MSPPSPAVSVIVFALNEGANVAPVLEELLKWLTAQPWKSEVVFVNDGSTDDTLKHAEAALASFPSHILSHRRNKGIGAAIKSGSSVATGDYVTFLPCDGQIPPLAVGTLFDAARTTGSDLVLSLYHARNDGLHRKVLSWGVRRLIRSVHGVDLQSEGPYLFKRRLMVPEQLPSDSFFLNFEFPIRALSSGLKVTQVTVPCRPRRSGQSKAAALNQVRAVTADLIGLRWRRIRSGLERAVGAKFE